MSDNQQHLSEADVAKRLGMWTDAKLGELKDRALMAAGSKAAMTRMNIRYVEQQLINDWVAYCEEEKMAGNDYIDRVYPTSQDIENFLIAKYDIQLNVEKIAPETKEADQEAKAEGEKPQVKGDHDKSKTLRANGDADGIEESLDDALVGMRRDFDTLVEEQVQLREMFGASGKYRALRKEYLSKKENEINQKYQSQISKIEAEIEDIPMTDPRYEKVYQKISQLRDIQSKEIEKLYASFPISPRDPNAKAAAKAATAELRGGSAETDTANYDGDQSGGQAAMNVRQIMRKIAVGMWQGGLVTIKRDGKVYSGKSAVASDDNGRRSKVAAAATTTGSSTKDGEEVSFDDDEDETTENDPVDDSAQIDAGGFYMDVEHFGEVMHDNKVDADDIHEIRQLFKTTSSPTEAFRQAEVRQKIAMIRVAVSSLVAVRETEVAITASDNLSASGNTFSFPIFTKTLKREGVSSRDLADIRNQFRSLIDAERVSSDDIEPIVKEISNQTDIGLAILALTKGVVFSIVPVGSK